MSKIILIQMYVKILIKGTFWWHGARQKGMALSKRAWRPRKRAWRRAMLFCFRFNTILGIFCITKFCRNDSWKVYSIFANFLVLAILWRSRTQQKLNTWEKFPIYSSLKLIFNNTCTKSYLYIYMHVTYAYFTTEMTMMKRETKKIKKICFRDFFLN